MSIKRERGGQGQEKHVRKRRGNTNEVRQNRQNIMGSDMITITIRERVSQFPRLAACA